jgi:hypothetical protein
MNTMGVHSPNFFELTGSDVRLTYALDRAGKHLTYKGPEGERTFGDQDIDSLDTPHGSLLTVQLKAIPDLETLDLTLLLPTINLPAPGDVVLRPPLVAGPERFSTLAILTTTRTSIGGPGLVTGPLQSYRALEMSGEASEVLF